MVMFSRPAVRQRDDQIKKGAHPARVLDSMACLHEYKQEAAERIRASAVRADVAAANAARSFDVVRRDQSAAGWTESLLAFLG
jgi:hypothetical protein